MEALRILEEKLKEAIVAELKRQAVIDPQSPGVESSDGFVVEGKIDLDDLAMVIAGRHCRRTVTAFAESAYQQAGSGTEIAAGRFPKNG
jgi:hypothetical protein